MKRFLPALLTLPLIACAADTTNYPSLARRDAEKAVNAAQPASSVAPVSATTTNDLMTGLTGLVEQARSAHQAFDSRKDKAEKAVAAGGSFGSESWGTATVALADLESARSDAMIALADLDGIYAAARIAGNNATEIAKARDQVVALIGEQDKVLTSLRTRLGR